MMGGRRTSLFTGPNNACATSSQNLWSHKEVPHGAPRMFARDFSDYFSTLPIRAMVKSMRDTGIPADISDTPGTFCCNHLMYGVLHHLATNHKPVRAGWVHLPHLPEVAALDENLGAPSMSVATAVSGIRAGIGAVLKHEHDIQDPIRSRLQI